MNNMMILLFVIPTYIVWRHYAAYKAKMVLAKKLDEYLGDDNQPELLKKIVYRMYEDSMNPFLAFQIAFSRAGSEAKRLEEDKLVSKLWKRELENLPKEDMDKFYQLVSAGIIVNFKVAPITHIGMIVLNSLKAIRNVNYSNVKSIPSAEKELAGTYLERLSI
ncbi:conserved hypothetical protein [Vibrio chagasii]|nr:conserved hypothetical protein [Vibrio chagasii]CAH7252519.1 conserved hypothetical protein [Vibrio chagasii]